MMRFHSSNTKAGVYNVLHGYKDDPTPAESVELAIAANDCLTQDESKAIRVLFDVIRNHDAKIYIAESICESYGWFDDANELHLNETGWLMVELARIATGKIKGTL